MFMSGNILSDSTMSENTMSENILSGNIPSDKIITKKQAVEAWVGTFNAIPRTLAEKLYDYGEVKEITPFAINDPVYISGYGIDGKESGGRVWHEGLNYANINGIGRIVDFMYDDYDKDCKHYKIDPGQFMVKMEYPKEHAGKVFQVSNECLSHRVDFPLPLWSKMWAFDLTDNKWLEEGGLEHMRDCGFRIYAQEDFGYIFGIDGAGYNFYPEHWIPLYEARGLMWHTPECEIEKIAAANASLEPTAAPPEPAPAPFEPLSR
jgi:hypothetical protein